MQIQIFAWYVEMNVSWSMFIVNFAQPIISVKNAIGVISKQKNVLVAIRKGHE